MPQSLHALSPLRVILGQEDVTGYLGDSWTFSCTDPGGFEACSLPFPRDLPNVLRGQPIRIMSGLATAWEGRTAQVQRSLGHNTTVMGEGFAALFKDASGSMVFADRDLTRWGSPSYTRQAALAAGSYQLVSSQVAADPTSNTPALVQTISGSWVSPWIPDCEAWYDAGPENLIAKVYYSVVPAGFGWTNQVVLSSDANLTADEASGNLGTASGYFGPGTAYRFALVQEIVSGTPGGGDGATYNTYWHNLAAYGNHGLTGRGSDPVGFYPSDIFGWTLGQVPGVQAGVVQQTDASNFIVPHYVQYLPVTLDQIASDMGTIQGWHWGVWESLSPLTGSALPRADFRPRPMPGAFTASCRRRDCDTLDIREDLSQQFNQAVVTFTDTAGMQDAVTVTADNPILDQAGIASKTVIFSGGTMTAATAALFGAEALQITNVQARVSGTADIISALDGGVRPAWLLRAGIDRLRIVDVPSTDAWGSMSDYPISRVEASISSGGFNTSVEIGSGAQLIETLQARLAAATAIAGGV